MGQRNRVATIRKWAVDILLFGSIVVVARLVVVDFTESAALNAEVRAVSREVSELQGAFAGFFDHYKAYPADYTDAALDVTTLDPLRKGGYYAGSVTVKLKNGRVDAYGAPDDRGSNQEFWVEMTLAADPSIRFLVANSDDAPLSAGRWAEGAYIYRNGKLEKL